MIKHICPGTIILYHILFKKSRSIHGFSLFSSLFFDYKKVIFFNFSLDKRIIFCYNRTDALFSSVPLKKRERLTRRSLSAEIARERTQTTRTSYPALRYRGLSRKFRKT